jgi:hypothetical protein
MARWPASGLRACGQQMDLDVSREMPMLSAAAAGAGCDAGPVPERPAECWPGLVARLRGDLGGAGVAGSQQPLCVLHPPAGQVLQGRPAGEPGEPRREGRSGQSRPCGESRHGPRRPGVLVDQSERRAELRAGERAEPAAATWRQAGYARRGSLRQAPWLIRQPIRPAGDSSGRPSLTVTRLRSDAVQRPADMRASPDPRPGRPSRARTDNLSRWRLGAKSPETARSATYPVDSSLAGRSVRAGRRPCHMTRHFMIAMSGLLMPADEAGCRRRVTHP